MRGSRAKQLRRMVDKRFAFLADAPLYVRNVRGTIELDSRCRRKFYRRLKKLYKHVRTHDNNRWRTIHNV